MLNLERPMVSGTAIADIGTALDKVNTLAPGSRPIIVPVGASTLTETVDVVEHLLSLDVSCTFFDSASIIASLAAQYGVDASQITLSDPCAGAARRRHRELSGSLQVTVTISTSSTSQTGASLSANRSE